MNFFILIGVLIVFSVVQSVLGIGLLVFGTPTLMILGSTFQEALSFVLPASICISFLQVLESTQKFNHTVKQFRKEFNLFCLPFVLFGLLFVLTMNEKIDLGLFVGGMLLVSGVIRLYKKFANALSKFIQKNRKLYLVFMGSIHGLTNMGGGLLTLFSSSVHSGEKEPTRSGVAYGYLFMGIIQYILLLIFNPEFFSLNILLYMVIAFISYFTFGKRLYVNTDEKIFHRVITGIILSYGIILIVK